MKMRAKKVMSSEARHKKQLIQLLTVVMLGIFVLVGMRSYAAIIQHENNVLMEENAYIQAEIDSLSSQIVEETKVTKIEKVATTKYDMVYPTPDNCVKLSNDDSGEKGLAATIRSEAYN
jgi:cell division protein FtsL